MNKYKKLFAVALLGLTCFALSGQAQLAINLREQATFGPFTGGTNNTVSDNGSFNTTEVIRTGTPVAAPFSITYVPTSLGPTTVSLVTDTLTTTNFVFASTLTPLNYFTSLASVINYDFDSDGIIDLTQNYTINLKSFTAPNGLTGVSYEIVPIQFFGNVTINGAQYGYASVVSDSVGTLFDGSSTTAAVQFQFLANPVPEPSTYALFGVMTLGGIMYFRRSNRRWLELGPSKSEIGDVSIAKQT